MKVKLPVVFAEMPLKVFELMFVLSTAIVFDITVKKPVDATDDVKAVKLLLFMFSVEVAVLVVVSTVIPCIAPDTPSVSEIVLLLNEFVNDPVGAFVKDGT